MLNNSFVLNLAAKSFKSPVRSDELLNLWRNKIYRIKSRNSFRICNSFTFCRWCPSWCWKTTRQTVCPWTVWQDFSTPRAPCLHCSPPIVHLDICSWATFLWCMLDPRTSLALHRYYSFCSIAWERNRILFVHHIAPLCIWRLRDTWLEFLF